MYGHDTEEEHRHPDGTRMHPKEVERKQILEDLLDPLDPNKDSRVQMWERLARAVAFFVRELH